MYDTSPERCVPGVGSYVGELQKPRGGGPIFFSAGGGLIFQNRGGPGGGSLQKFSLEFHRVIQINKNIEK